MTPQTGGCLCGASTYKVTAEPRRVTICHCTHCQRATGSAYMVMPIFLKTDFIATGVKPAVYEHRSNGTGTMLFMNFCPTCGTKLYQTIERFKDIVGVFGGTFDDPGWFDRGPETTRHIFVDYAQKGTVIPAGFHMHREHVIGDDGTLQPSHVFDEPFVAG